MNIKRIALGTMALTAMVLCCVGCSQLGAEPASTGPASTQANAAVGGSAAEVATAPARAEVIIATKFLSGENEIAMNGTQTGLTTNVPGGKWTWAAGGTYSYGGPTLAANWDAAPLNAVDLCGANGGDDTVLALSLAGISATQLTISGTIAVWQNTTTGGGIGFWSAITPANNSGVASTQNFTGIMQRHSPAQPDDGALQLYVSGVAVGDAVNTGVATSAADADGSNQHKTSAVYNTLQFTVTPATGAISHILLNGKAVAMPATSTPFTAAYVGVMSGAGARASFSSLSISTAGSEPTGR